jgi:hypothetical protein
MPASMSFNCEFCATFSTCKNKPENHLKDVGKGGICFTSKKTADQVKNVVWGKKGGRKKKLNKTVEEEEIKDGNV